MTVVMTKCYECRSVFPMIISGGVYVCPVCGCKYEVVGEEEE